MTSAIMIRIDRRFSVDSSTKCGAIIFSLKLNLTVLFIHIPITKSPLQTFSNLRKIKFFTVAHKSFQYFSFADIYRM